MYRQIDDCPAVRHPVLPRPRRTPVDRPLSVRLANGGAATLRPLLRGEHHVLDHVFGGLSPRSRRQRFLVPMPRLPGAARRSLADVDGTRHVAWVALVGERPVGIARYIRTGAGAAEVAFEVVDDHQGRGIGSALLDALATVALADGVATLEASVEPDNHPSIRLLTRIGIGLAPVDGLLEGRGPLRLPDPPRVNRLAALHLAAAALDAGSSR